MLRVGGNVLFLSIYLKIIRDYVKAREALEKVDKLSEQALIDEGKIDQLISHRTEQMRDRFEGQIATLQDKNHNAGAGILQREI